MRLCCRVLRSFTPVIWFYWNVLRSFTPVFFPLSGKKKRLAGCFVPVPRGRNRHLQVLMPFEGYRALFGSLRDCAFLYGDSDGVTGDEGTRGRGATESAAQLSALLREPIGFAVFSAGSTLGLRVPNLRQRVKCGSRTAASLDSPHAAAGFVGRDSLRRHPGIRKDLTESNLCSVRSGWYDEHICTRKRPDSSRPQAAKSRVKAREAERKSALPTTRVYGKT